MFSAKFINYCIEDTFRQILFMEFFCLRKIQKNSIRIITNNKYSTYYTIQTIIKIFNSLELTYRTINTFTLSLHHILNLLKVFLGLNFISVTLE